MSDEHLRALERRWSETGAVDDGVAVLAHLLRVGRLSLGNLRLLAYLQHEAAKRVLAAECPVERVPRVEQAGEPADRVYQWVLGFADVCEPEDRGRVAERVLGALTRAGLHAPARGQAPLAEERPWVVMLGPASICSGLVAKAPSPPQEEDRIASGGGPSVAPGEGSSCGR